MEGNSRTVYGVDRNTGHWYHDTQDAHFQFAVTLTGESNRAPSSETVYFLLACALLKAMPQSGLEESCRVLNEVFEYHSFRPLALLPAPVLPRIKAKLRPAIKQSGFQIESE
jgi:hypothetical protein